MSTFPLLKTGAVMQYPASRAEGFSTQVIRFVDGSEQRFADYPAPLRRWIVRLNLLDEAEMHRLQEFFRAEQDVAGTFQFTDPWTGTAYPNCCLESDQLTEVFVGEMRGRATVVVRELRS